MSKIIGNVDKNSKRDTKNNALYIRIDSVLKRDFNIKCVEKNTNMTEVLLESIKSFLEN